MLLVCSAAERLRGTRRHQMYQAAPGRGESPEGTAPYGSGDTMWTVQHGQQRTLNPRVRGSSPWRHTLPELAVLSPGAIYLIFGWRLGITWARALFRAFRVRDRLGRNGSGLVGPPDAGSRVNRPGSTRD